MSGGVSLPLSEQVSKSPPTVKESCNVLFDEACSVLGHVTMKSLGTVAMLRLSRMTVNIPRGEIPTLVGCDTCESRQAVGTGRRCVAIARGGWAKVLINILVSNSLDGSTKAVSEQCHKVADATTSGKHFRLRKGKPLQISRLFFCYAHDGTQS
jgi:hypothetical protein